jgi:hypothetical protein
MSRSTTQSLSAFALFFAGILLFSASLIAPTQVHKALVPSMHQSQTVVADGAMPPPVKPGSTKPLMVS